jgi:hypothetical protein
MPDAKFGETLQQLSGGRAIRFPDQFPQRLSRSKAESKAVALGAKS